MLSPSSARAAGRLEVAVQPSQPPTPSALSLPHSFHAAVILNLPNSMAKLGMIGGALTQVGCAAAAVYTLFLLVALYHEYKRAEVRPQGGCIRALASACAWLGQHACANRPRPYVGCMRPKSPPVTPASYTATAVTANVDQEGHLVQRWTPAHARHPVSPGHHRHDRAALAWRAGEVRPTPRKRGALEGRGDV